MSKRIDYIDIARGIGILLVVMGHNDFIVVAPFAYKFIYAFHMPLFFFLSGMFFKLNQPFFTLMQRRFNSILKPYIVAIVMIYIMTLSFTRVNMDVATSRVLKAIYANAYYIDWVQLWFLPHLFALNIFAFAFYWLVKRSPLPWLKWVLLVLIQTIGVITISWFLPFTISAFGRQITLNGLPFSLDLILVSGFFFILGSEVNKLQPAKVLSHPLTVLGSGLVLLVMVIFLPQKIDYAIRVFNSLPINTLEAVLGIIFILALSKQIERVAWLSSIFRYVGQASLIILIFHVPIQETWGEKMMMIFNNKYISYWIAYIVGVLGPLAIYTYIIQPNPIVRSWFGLPQPVLPPAEPEADSLTKVI